MARKPKAFAPDQVQAQRKRSGLNQAQYWNRFGVTQSGGSRYEGGRNIPTPVAMLVWLRDVDRISDADLADALKAVKGRGG